MGWTTEEDKKVLNLREAGHSYKDIATIMLGEFQRKFTKDSVRNRIDRLKGNPRMASEKKTPKLRVRTTEEFIPVQEEKSPSIPEYNYKDEVEIGKDGVQRSDKLLRMNEAERKDPDFLMEAHGYDPKEWEIISSKSSMWNQHNQEDKTIVLYSSKISVKPRVKELHEQSMKEVITEIMKDYKSPVHKPLKFKKGGKLVEFSASDLHVGKLGLESETGENYNHHIARERFFYAINDVIDRIKNLNVEKIVFIHSHDFFHIDTLQSTTTRGTPQDSSMKLPDMFKYGVQMLVEAIDLFSQVAPVETKYVGANHDLMMSYFASEFLGAWYRNNKYVTVDTNPMIRKYLEFGNTLLMFTHGHAEKKRIGSVMQTEMREAWGRTKYHIVHAGHFHAQKMLLEENGVTVHHTSSMSGKDLYHYNAGYVDSTMQTQSFIYDKEKGLENILYTVV